MKKLFFILTVLLGTSLSVEAAAFNRCAELKPQPRLSFYTSYGKLEYDFSKDQMGITKVGMSYGVIEKGIFANGLATGTVKWEVDVSSEGREGRNGEICAYPVEIKFYLGFADPKIYVSRDLRKGSCMYDLVLRHEQTHQQINTAALEYFIPRLKSAALSVLNNVPPQRIDNSGQIDATTRQFVHTYSAQLEPLINFFKAELLREQSKLDNHENYQLEGSLCRYYNQNHRR